MHRRRLPWLAVPALLALVGVVGYAWAVTSGLIPPQLPSPPPSSSSLHVLRTSDFPQNHIPPFATTVTDANKITHLYMTIQALPAYPTGEFCPVDFGVYYQLTFHSTTSPVPQVDIDATGCQGVSFGSTHSAPQKSVLWSPQFWQLFAQTLGVSASSLSVLPQDTGPSAPTPSS
jgi:hypothetical protein